MPEAPVQTGPNGCLAELVGVAQGRLAAVLRVKEAALSFGGIVARYLDH